MATTISKLNNLEGFSISADFIFTRYSVNLLDSSQLIAKRFIEILIVSTFLILVASWLFPIIALLIKMETKGPVFYRQLRHGQNNVPFYCLKFRSMKFDPNSGFKQATKGDARVTKVGAFLRKSSLDELPQLINVLIGEMAIVGPRPHAIPMNKEFAEKMEFFMCRHMVKPGITGLAQAKGYRGEINDMFDMNARLRYDLFYIKNWSFLFDLKIILLTFHSLIFANKNAY
ncbi:putative colanic acid biosynthesis UDP-glucose lipid carrier transferase [Algoriphagus iocasae]|jgi:putative colanic acid biosysnthesis UDP-glucose lipid carrier transferase|uniref:Putative colanic acid biosynthesis UDP-glucose lipid carrier transferase n=1 Tax=Algoriphagus iocasae TaxID=1836499 RepID=A0A841MV02_9BACT|nr:sugar transferase [Algoriphagus iocasae]MBB6327916.1 putative colanic acid biosynthesis UDP-glucose lipid carrier transferase [Algoriphagus iocasae]